MVWGYMYMVAHAHLTSFLNLEVVEKCSSKLLAI